MNDVPNLFFILVKWDHIGEMVKRMVDTGSFQRLAGSAERAPDAGPTLVLHSGRASQAISLRARAQSCICWTSEGRADAGAIIESPFAGKLTS